VNRHNGDHDASNKNTVQGISYKSASHYYRSNQKTTGGKALTEGDNVIQANFHINCARLKKI